jgi:tRNA (cytidine/uridine-2'-O-)-methyltransferase
VEKIVADLPDNCTRAGDLAKFPVKSSRAPKPKERTIVTKTTDFHIALVEPDVPPNTGAVARLCVATESTLYLVGRLGFHLDDRRIRRAGLDYWQHARIEQHTTLEDCITAVGPCPIFYFSARAQRLYTEASFPAKCLLVFGSETRGLPPSVLAQQEHCWKIPIFDERVRSLNVATTVGIVLYEAVRQNRSIASRPSGSSQP